MPGLSPVGRLFSDLVSGELTNGESANNPSVAAESTNQPEAQTGRYRAWRVRHRAKLARRSRARIWGTRGAITIVLLIVVIVAATVAYTKYQLGQIHHFNSHGTTVTAKGPTENILLIGSTSRCAASSIGEFKYQCVVEHKNGVNSDVVFIAHLDARNHSVSLLSIPRDAFVPGARSGNTLCGRTWSYTPGLCANKIDSALVEGPDQLAQAIEQDFGIPINHIVDLNFAHVRRPGQRPRRVVDVLPRQARRRLGGPVHRPHRLHPLERHRSARIRAGAPTSSTSLPNRPRISPLSMRQTLRVVRGTRLTRVASTTARATSDEFCGCTYS